MREPGWYGIEIMCEWKSSPYDWIVCEEIRLRKERVERFWLAMLALTENRASDELFWLSA